MFIQLQLEKQTPKSPFMLKEAAPVRKWASLRRRLGQHFVTDLLAVITPLLWVFLSTEPGLISHRLCCMHDSGAALAPPWPPGGGRG